MPLYPITFSIAESKLVKSIPKKERMISNLIPGELSTYIYTTEEEYYTQYKESYFALTTKKAGWDCMRHYEILACGCIPYFPDIELCPPYTMALLPKHMIKEGNSLYMSYKNKEIDEDFTSKYMNLSSRMLDYTYTNLTTKKMAEYILTMSRNTGAKTILYLSGKLEPDYLRCLTLQGFKELMGSSCHDYPKVEHIYTNAKINYSSKYGTGFSYTNLVDQSLHDTNLDLSVEEDIRNKKYDIIIYGSYHRGMPFYDLVMNVYKAEEVILLCGEDEHDCTFSIFAERGHHVFVRELQV
jgi:hypothetical protein